MNCAEYTGNVTNAPFTLQAILPMVRGFTQQRNPLCGHRMLSKIWCIIHTADGVIHSYRHWVTRPCPSTTIRGSYVTLCNSGEMFMHLPLTLLCHRISP